MNVVATKKLLFILMDDQNRCYRWLNNRAQAFADPVWLNINPDGWKDMTLNFATNQRYFATLRSFSSPVNFVEDGKLIIADRMINGRGTEEIMYLAILRYDPSGGLNYYKLEYKSRLDFSKFSGDPRTGITMNTLQDDVFSLVTASDTVKYLIPCNSSNPSAIRVLFDGILLQDKFNYQVVELTRIQSRQSVIFIPPLVFLNNEGDNVGIVFESPTYQELGTRDITAFVQDPTSGNFVMSTQSDITITARGTISFVLHNTVSDPKNWAATFFFMKTGDTYDLPVGLPPDQLIFDDGGGTGPGNFPDVEIPNGVPYTFDFSSTIDLKAGEKLWFFLRFVNPRNDSGYIELQQTGISFLFASEQVPSLAYALRPFDVLQSLVSQITNGKYSADSNFFRRNNRRVMTSGSALRNFPDANIQISFSDFFKDYSAVYNLCITIVNGTLFVEPVGAVYNSNGEIMGLGAIAAATLTSATDQMYGSVKVGYAKQTYNKRNGRYDYNNGSHQYKMALYTIQNELDLVSTVIRADPFGIEFIRTGYPDLNSTDDRGDGDPFAVMISDAVGQDKGVVSNAITVNIETLILAQPVIKTPLDQDTVHGARPTLTGVSQKNLTINIYVDGILNGTTKANSGGEWRYTVQNDLRPLSNFFNGVHTLVANAQTDPANASGFSRSVTVIINTRDAAPFIITSPSNNDALYDNLPLIQGLAKPGSIVTVNISGTVQGTCTADGSGIWQYQVFTPIPDGRHSITAAIVGLPNAQADISVNKNVDTPLITSIYYDETLYTNQPIIKGVGIPGTTVSLYVDGIGGDVDGFGIAGPVKQTVINAAGDWSILVDRFRDASSLLLTYIPDGQHVFSTTPQPVNVLASIAGYRLMRGTNKGPVMDYDSIKLDDQYVPVGIDPVSLPPTLGQFLHPETLYNIEESTPLRMLKSHENILHSFLIQQNDTEVIFNGAENNANLVTSKSGLILNEAQNLTVGNMAPNIFLPYYLTFTAQVPFTFNDIMTGLGNHGYISATFNDIPLFFLPIGNMNMKLATNEAQEFKLLLSSKTPIASLLQLFSTGATFKIGKNMLYTSQRNPLHFVKYNTVPAAGYHFQDIYDNWLQNRYPRWLENPCVPQPVQVGDIFPLQWINNGSALPVIKMFSCETGVQVDEFDFAPVMLNGIASLLIECVIETTGYPEGRYWYQAVSGAIIFAISEPVYIKADWPDTMLFEYSGSKDEQDYFFSTGITPAVRMYSEFLPWNPESEGEIFEEENGSYVPTRYVPKKTRVLQIGSESGFVPDWMILMMNVITGSSNLRIDGYGYGRDDQSKFEKSNEFPGYPMYLWKMEVVEKENATGFAFQGEDPDGTHTTVYSIDNLAFGLQPGVTNVTIENE